MKKKLVSIKFDTKKGKIRIPKFLSKKFQKRYNNSVTKDEQNDPKQLTEFEKFAVVYNDMLIIPINNMYNVDNMINAFEKIGQYEIYMREEMRKLNNEGGIYFRMDFDMCSIPMSFMAINAGEYFYYNNHVYIKNTMFGALRLIDSKNFITIIEEEDILESQINKIASRRDYTVIQVYPLVRRDKRL